MLLVLLSANSGALSTLTASQKDFCSPIGPYEALSNDFAVFFYIHPQMQQMANCDLHHIWVRVTWLVDWP
jgi:hypothetical protein